MPSVVIPDAERLREHGVARLVGVPVLLHDDGGFHAEASAYLRDRALFRWRFGEKRGGAAKRVPSEKTLAGAAEDLAHFLDYCAATRIDWRRVEWSGPQSKRSIEGYMTAMRMRRRRVRGEVRVGLAARTIERRVSTAIDFLDFAAGRGWRTSLPILPAIRLAPKPGSIEIPDAAEVAAWREAARARYARLAVNRLVIESILEMGLRNEEVCLLRDGDIPRPQAFKPGPYQVILIQYGTKGYRTPGDLEKRGKPRKVRVATAWLEELDLYRRTKAPWGRKAALARFRAMNPKVPLPKELFLTTTKGTPFTPDYVRLVFDGVGDRPCPGWTPHGGRHFYACRTLVDLIERDRRRAGCRRRTSSRMPTPSSRDP